MEMLPVVRVRDAKPVLVPHDAAICAAVELEYVEAVAVAPEPENDPVTVAEPAVSGRVNP